MKSEGQKSIDQRFFSNIKEGVATFLSFEPRKSAIKMFRKNNQTIKDDFADQDS